MIACLFPIILAAPTVSAAAEQTPLTTTPASKSGSPRAYISKVQFKGNTVISSQDLAAGIEHLIDRDLTMPDLQKIATEVGNIYRSHGYWATAVLPEQTLSDGVLYVVVVEARIGNISLDQVGEELRFNKSRILEYLNAGQDSSDIFNKRAFEHALHIVDNIPGITAAAELGSGDKVGETNIKVKVENTQLVTGGIFTDNHGVSTTGRARISGVLQLNSPFGFGEQLGVDFLRTSGTKTTGLNTTVPVGRNGISLGANFAYSEYILGGQYAHLEVDGWSKTKTLRLSNIPIFNEKNTSIMARLGFTEIDAEDEALNSVLARKGIQKGLASVSLSQRDNFFGGGTFSASSLFSYGRLNLKDDASNYTFDQVSSKTHGTFNKVNINISRLQKLGEQYSLWVSANGQIAFDNLDGLEEFNAGGPSAVRGYSGSVDSGDQGAVLTAELRRSFGTDLQLSAFYDYGYTKINHETWNGWDNAGSELGNSYEISSVGLGMVWFAPYGFELNMVVAAPVGSPPSSSFEDKVQFWGNLKKKF